MPPVTQYLESKAFRCIGIFSENPNPRLPGVKTLREQGLDIILMQNNGIFAPKDTPEAVLATLCAALKKTCADPGFQKELTDNNLDVVYLDGQAYHDLLAREFATLQGIAESLQK